VRDVGDTFPWNRFFEIASAINDGRLPGPPQEPQEDDMPTIVAKDFIVNPARPTEGYVLDARGGIHPVGGAPAPDAANVRYFDNGVAQRLVITDWARPAGYVMDVIGGLHPFGNAPALVSDAYWPNGFQPPAPRV
jgi:hypothetical protein